MRRPLSVPVSGRLPENLLIALDDWAAQSLSDRSKVISALLETAIESAIRTGAISEPVSNFVAAISKFDSVRKTS